MSGSIRVEYIIDGSGRSEQTELIGMIRLEQSGVKAIGGETQQIGAEQEHHVEREEPCQKKNKSAVRRS